MKLIVAIDASRNRSGGGRNHLVGILSESEPTKHGIREVHVWSYRSLLDAVPDRPWLVKHCPPELDRSLTSQLWWQRFRFPIEARESGCDIVLNTDAGSVSRLRPSVSMSRDMLPYEPRELDRLGLSRARLRHAILHRVHNATFRSSDGVIFLANYAAHVIQQSCGTLGDFAVIPHGVGRGFKEIGETIAWPSTGQTPIECLYVSNIAMYKHQWVVVRAMRKLRDKGYNVRLTLAGGGPGSGVEKAEALLDREIAVSDPDHCFVIRTGAVPYSDLPALLRGAHVFVFASSCENMPNTLLEAMAAGLPIACSNRGPMQEVLRDGGVFFDPEDDDTIAGAVEALIGNRELRERVARAARAHAMQYSWERCGSETWEYLVRTHDRVRYGRGHQEATAVGQRWGAGKEVTPTRAPRTPNEHRICTKCVMDTTDPHIVFDGRGVCDHCNTFYGKILPSWHTGEGGRRSLERISRRIKEAGVGREFDCIVGVSGGTDSSYLVYIAKEQMGLRPLVFHVDTGWNSRESVNNIGALLDKLGLDLYTEVIDWEEMRDLQLAFFKAGVPHVDTPQDHAIFASLYRFAIKHDVRFILTGANLSTECIRNPIEWMYFQSDSIQLRDIHERFGTRPLATFPTTSILWHKVFLPYVKGIRTVKPLDHVRYTREEAAKLLHEKFGWEAYGEKHYESRFTKFFEGYWLYKKFGYDVRKVQYSSLILTKQMTRDEALDRLSRPPFDETTVANEFEYVATKLGISVGELRGYLDAPNKTYRDYKNQAWVYSIGARAMRMLGLELGGKR